MALDIATSCFKNIILVEEVYEQWMNLVEDLGSTHSEMAQHLLIVHEKSCQQCKNNRQDRGQIRGALNPVIGRTKSRRKPQVVTARKDMVQFMYSDESDDDRSADDTGQTGFKVKVHDKEASLNHEPPTNHTSDNLHIPVQAKNPVKEGPTPLFISKVRPVTPPVGQSIPQEEKDTYTSKIAEKDSKTQEILNKENVTQDSSEGDFVKIKEEPADYDDEDATDSKDDSQQDEVAPRMVMFNNEVLQIQNNTDLSSMYFTWTEDEVKKERQRLKWREERRKQRQMQKEKNTPEQEEERKRRERERMRNYRANLNPEYKAMVRERDRERIKKRRLEMTEEEKVMIRQRNAAQKRIKRKLARMSLTAVMPEDMMQANGMSLPVGMMDSSNTSPLSGLSSTENEASEDSFSSNPQAFLTAENPGATSFLDTFSRYSSLPTAFPDMREHPLGRPGPSAFPSIQETVRKAFASVSDSIPAAFSGRPKPVPAAFSGIPKPVPAAFPSVPEANPEQSSSTEYPSLQESDSASDSHNALQKTSERYMPAVQASSTQNVQPSTPPVQRPLLPQALNALPVAFPTFVNSSELPSTPSTVSEAS